MIDDAALRRAGFRCFVKPERGLTPTNGYGGFLVPRKIADKLARMFHRDGLLKAVQDAQWELDQFDKEERRRERISAGLRRYHARRKRGG